MAAEALRLATEATQLDAAAVLMRAMSVELERHQATAGAMELETQIGASSTVGDEAQGTGVGGSEVTGGGGGRRKRQRPQVHNNRAARSGQRKKEEGRYKRGRDGRDG